MNSYSIMNSILIDLCVVLNLSAYSFFPNFVLSVSKSCLMLCIPELQHARLPSPLSPRVYNSLIYILLVIYSAYRFAYIPVTYSFYNQKFVPFYPFCPGPSLQFVVLSMNLDLFFSLIIYRINHIVFVFICLISPM